MSTEKTSIISNNTGSSVVLINLEEIKNQHSKIVSMESEIENYKIKMHKLFVDTLNKLRADCRLDENIDLEYYLRYKFDITDTDRRRLLLMESTPTIEEVIKITKLAYYGLNYTGLDESRKLTRIELSDKIRLFGGFHPIKKNLKWSTYDQVLFGTDRTESYCVDIELIEDCEGVDTSEYVVTSRFTEDPVEIAVSCIMNSARLKYLHEDLIFIKQEEPDLFTKIEKYCTKGCKVLTDMFGAIV